MVIASHLYLYNLQQTNEVPSLNQYLRYVSWSPSGNAIAYVDYNNNLHYRYKVKPSHLPNYSPLERGCSVLSGKGNCGGQTSPTHFLE